MCIWRKIYTKDYFMVLFMMIISEAIKHEKSVEWYVLVPVCQCHHDVERRQNEHGMEEGVAVSHALRLIIINFLAVLQVHVSVSTHKLHKLINQLFLTTATTSADTRKPYIHSGKQVPHGTRQSKFTVALWKCGEDVICNPSRFLTTVDWAGFYVSTDTSHDVWQNRSYKN